AEEIFFDDITTGASGDIQAATRIAKSMVTTYGMSDLGPIQYDQGSESVFLGRDYNSPSNASSQVAYEIDVEVRKIIDQCHERAWKIIMDHKDELVKIAEALMVQETLTAEEIDAILAGDLVLKDGKLLPWEDTETVIDITPEETENEETSGE
ncbi:MAG: cell division protein FtsH, partial [Erysipelotrichaceae bacterium]|nr:cell division protein FtsH [Erysipelotrichaceae bacterium]